jgi:hypothetical protein
MSTITELATRELTPFEGSPVYAVKVEIPGAAGGLRDAMSFDPVELSRGDEVVIVMKCKVEAIRFEGNKEHPEGQTRVQILKPLADSTTFVDEVLVAEALRQTKNRLREMREKKAGITRLFDEDGNEVVGPFDADADQDPEA